MHKLPDLQYDYDALQPYISKDIMELHHKKHHQTYVDKLNIALKNAPENLSNLSIENLLQRLDEFPDSIRQTIRNNGGGHYNHSLFWTFMVPGGNKIKGDLAKALEDRYNNIDNFKDEFSNKAIGVFGSGWAWLLPDLSIVTTPNQDSPIMKGIEPILGLDVWEHAYYLDYKNVRPSYIDAWWNVVNWDAVEDRYYKYAGTK